MDQNYICSICGRHQLDGSEACPHCGGAWKELRKKSVASLVMGILSLVFSVGLMVLILLASVFWVLLLILTFGQYSEVSGIQSVGYVGAAVLSVFSLGSLTLCIVQTVRRRRLAIAGLVLTVLALGMDLITFLIISGIQAG